MADPFSDFWWSQPPSSLIEDRPLQHIAVPPPIVTFGKGSVQREMPPFGRLPMPASWSDALNQFLSMTPGGGGFRGPMSIYRPGWGDAVNQFATVMPGGLLGSTRVSSPLIEILRRYGITGPLTGGTPQQTPLP